jgi:hypothetical protein
MEMVGYMLLGALLLWSFTVDWKKYKFQQDVRRRWAEEDAAAQRKIEQQMDWKQRRLDRLEAEAQRTGNWKQFLDELRRG